MKVLFCRVGEKIAIKAFFVALQNGTSQERLNMMALHIMYEQSNTIEELLQLNSREIAIQKLLGKDLNRELRKPFNIAMSSRLEQH